MEVKVVDLNAPAPSKDEADLIVITHIKKASYLFSPRTAETPYAFTISIDGREFKESLKGAEEVDSKLDEERGRGIHYVLMKRLRLKPGSYTIALKSEDGRSARTKRDLAGGKIYTLSFDPVYGPSKFGRRKSFWKGVIDYRVSFREENS